MSRTFSICQCCRYLFTWKGSDGKEEMLYVCRLQQPNVFPTLITKDDWAEEDFPDECPYIVEQVVMGQEDETKN